MIATASVARALFRSGQGPTRPLKRDSNDRDGLRCPRSIQKRAGADAPTQVRLQRSRRPSLPAQYSEAGRGRRAHSSEIVTIATASVARAVFRSGLGPTRPFMRDCNDRDGLRCPRTIQKRAGADASLLARLQRSRRPSLPAQYSEAGRGRRAHSSEIATVATASVARAVFRSGQGPTRPFLRDCNDRDGLRCPRSIQKRFDQTLTPIVG